MQSSSSRIKINAVASLLQQVITVICGLILPRLILNSFGSSYNGLTSSITQFVSCVTLLSAGIGGVTRAALYRPLLEKNNKEISNIVLTTQRFMRKVAIIFAAALIIFAIMYPVIINKEFSWLFSFSLIVIIGASTFITNFFGVAYQLLLRADQKNYIVLFVQTFTIVLNTIVSSVLLLNGFGLHAVKFGTTIIYALQPLIIVLYCRKYYNIDVNAEINNKYIAQRWDAFSQRIALFIHSNTDIMVLTVFMTLADVSIYAVYSYVIQGIEQVIKSLGIGVDAAFGKLLISDDLNSLNKKFSQVEYVIFSITTVLFTSTALLILPFVELYTKGIGDANYHQTLFAVLFIVAESIFCIRMPYQDIIEAKGAFRETRNGAIVEMIINLAVSVILVKKLGLVGVSIGTICAMTFRTLQYVIYLRNNILHRSLVIFFKRLIYAIICCSISVIICRLSIDYTCPNYFIWAIKAVCTVVITGGVWFFISIIVERENLMEFLQFLGFKKILRKIRKKV